MLALFSLFLKAEAQSWEFNTEVTELILLVYSAHWMDFSTNKKVFLMLLQPNAFSFLFVLTRWGRIFIKRIIMFSQIFF